jgi:hypothetical protein
MQAALLFNGSVVTFAGELPIAVWFKYMQLTFNEFTSEVSGIILYIPVQGPSPSHPFNADNFPKNH